MEMLTSLYLYSKYLKNNTELQIFEDFCENGKYKQKTRSVFANDKFVKLKQDVTRQRERFEK